MTTRKISIVDYGAGNLRSIQKALARVAPDADVQITADPAELDRAHAVVLPGVGAARATMEHLEQSGLVEPVRRAAQSGRPFLGVCLGLQLLYEHHEEGDVPGLGILPGTARRFLGELKVPHMGWNRVDPLADSPILAGLEPGSYFYFVHSYYVEPEDSSGVVATTTYGPTFCSVLQRDNIWATQFHPEKSSDNGMRLLTNFVQTVSSEQWAVKEQRSKDADTRQVCTDAD